MFVCEERQHRQNFLFLNDRFTGFFMVLCVFFFIKSHSGIGVDAGKGNVFLETAGY